MKHAKKRNKVKAGPIVVLVAVVLGLVGFGVQKANKGGAFDEIKAQATERSETNTQRARQRSGVETIKIAVVTWGGYAGGQYFNEGFAANTNSRFSTEYGFDVEFILEDDPSKSLELWKNDEIQLHWYTADAFATILPEIAQYDPKIVFQSDWSRGGDAIVANSNIANVEALRGKRVAVAPKTASHSLLITTLNANNMSLDDIVVVETPSAIEASALFQDGDVDAAVVWSPDDQVCIAEVRGAKILTSTKDATNLIADIFFAKGAWVEAHTELLNNLITGWLTGNAEINSSGANKTKAADILALGLNQNVEDCESAIDNVRLATLGDNKNFFKINREYAGITGNDVYKNMKNIYADLGLAPQNAPRWRDITSSNIRDISLSGSIHKAEPVFTFVGGTSATGTAFASKDVTINFGSGSYVLSEEAKRVIDADVSQIILTFGGVRVRVEGNTDNTGSLAVNNTISRRRAQAVVDYLVSEYQFDANKFVVVGNGPSNPVATNNNSAGRAKNRRTEIKFIN